MSILTIKNCWNVHARATEGKERSLYAALTCALSEVCQGAAASADGAWHLSEGEDFYQPGKTMWKLYLYSMGRIRILRLHFPIPTMN